MESLFVLLSVIACVYANLVDNSQLCESSTMKLVLRSHYNKTGMWQSQVVFKQDERFSSDEEESGQWTMDVEQTTSVCADEGKSTLETTLFLTAPALKPLNSPPAPEPPKEPSPPAPATVPPPKAKTPPHDYKLYDGVGYYKFHNGVTTWPAAQARCAAEGGHLVIINSPAEREVVRNLFAVLNPKSPGSTNPDQVHVGLKRVGHMKYVTIFGVPMEETGFSEWYPRQPSGGANEPCISIMQQTITYNDISCTKQILPSICEFPLN